MTRNRLIFTLISLGLVAAVVGGYILLPIYSVLDLLVGAVTGCGPLLYVWFKRRARLRRFEALFPDTLEFIARSMRAGHAFSVSLEMIHREFQEPVAGEFRRTFEEHNLGLPIEVALQKLATRVPSLDVHFFLRPATLAADLDQGSGDPGQGGGADGGSLGPEHHEEPDSEAVGQRS